MTTKTKGRPLPPLLPLEYCKLDRAARMLDCELEDILHWAEIGVIDVKYKVTDQNRLYGECELDKKDLAWLFNNGEVEYMSPLREGEGFYWSNSASGQFIAFEFTQFYETSQELEEVLMAAIQGTTNDTVFSKVSPFGLFSISSYSINEIITGAKKLKNPVLTMPVSEIGFVFRDQEVDTNDLLIDSESLAKLHKAIVTGEPLKSRFNDANIAKDMQQKDRSAAITKSERNSSGRAEATLSLIELALTAAKLDRALIDNPYKLYTEINNNLRQHGLAEIQISDRAFADMLGIAKSSRLTRQSKLTN